LTNVPEGTHLVKFSKYGYNDAYYTVTCVTGFESHVNATLCSLVFGWATMHQITVGLIVIVFLGVVVIVYKTTTKPKIKYKERLA
jgi:hypothetical protein